jgi:hypothetical protein
METPSLRCGLCGENMKFEGTSELAGTSEQTLFATIRDRTVRLFSCQCGRTQTVELESSTVSREI